MRGISMKYSKVSFFLIAAVFFCVHAPFYISASNEPAKRTTDNRALLIFVDNSVDNSEYENKKIGVITQAVATAILDGACPMLVSTSLLLNIYENTGALKNKLKRALYDQVKMALDVSSGDEVIRVAFSSFSGSNQTDPIMLLLPEKYGQKYGLSGRWREGLPYNSTGRFDRELAKRGYENFKKSSAKLENEWINVLKSFFMNKKAYRGLENTPPQWSIYMMGSDGDGSKKAGLTIEAFKELLDFLNGNIITRLFIYDTASRNKIVPATLYQAESPVPFSKKLYNFPIIALTADANVLLLRSYPNTKELRHKGSYKFKEDTSAVLYKSGLNFEDFVEQVMSRDSLSYKDAIKALKNNRKEIINFEKPEEKRSSESKRIVSDLEMYRELYKKRYQAEPPSSLSLDELKKLVDIYDELEGIGDLLIVDQKQDRRLLLAIAKIVNDLQLDVSDLERPVGDLSKVKFVGNIDRMLTFEKKSRDSDVPWVQFTSPFDTRYYYKLADPRLDLFNVSRLKSPKVMAEEEKRQPEALRMWIQDYKIHLMPRKRTMPLVLYLLAKEIITNKAFRDAMEGMKFYLLQPETSKINEIPTIVLYPKHGKNNAQLVLDTMYNLYKGLEGLDIKPRFNEKSTSLIYWAQGGGDDKIRYPGAFESGDNSGEGRVTYNKAWVKDVLGTDVELSLQNPARTS